MSARKRYRPKHRPSTNTLFVAMQGVMLLTQEDVAKASEPVTTAITHIAQGAGSQADWQAVFDALNMLEQFGRMPKVMRGAADYVHSMQTVIVGVLDRQRASGSKALYPGELEDLRGFVDQWAEVLSVVTHREYFEAEEKTHQRLVSILRSKTPGVRVVEVAG